MPVEISVPPVEVAVPLLNLPTVTLPSVELPVVTLPRTDLPTVAGLVPQVDQRPGPPGTTSVRQTLEQTAGTPQSIVAGTGSMVLNAHTLKLSVEAWAMTSIGPPAVVILEELGQRIGATEVPASIGPVTALILAAAIGAAATGTASSGSASAGGLAVLSGALRLPALSGSRRLSGRLRESAFRTPRRPGFSPD